MYRSVFAVLAVAVVVLVSAGQAAAQLTRSAVGQNAGDVQAAVDQFRADLGPLQSGPSSGAGPNARREINWDGVPDSASTPNAFPGNFFNQATGSPAGRVRGIRFLTAGTFEMSSTAASGVPILFSNRHPDNDEDFAAFSPERIFGINGSNVMDVVFSVPGTPAAPAVVRGFGAMFTDVEQQGAVKLEYFDAASALIHTATAPAFPFPGGDSGKSFSFVGTSFASPVVARVRITNGGYDVNLVSFGVDDATAMDDFLYGEPIGIPEPTGMALIAAGLAALCRRARAPVGRRG